MVWWLSYFSDGVVDFLCDGCLVWWISYFTHGVVNVWCDGCLMWWMSYFTCGEVDVYVVDVVQSALFDCPRNGG